MNVNDEALRRLDDVMARLQRVMKTRTPFKDFGLTSSQVFILRYLESCGHAKSSDIGRIVGLSPGAVTQVTDELIRMGFVERSRSVDDRRVVYVSLTSRGVDMVEEIRIRGSKGLLAVLEQLPQKDADEFIRILSNVIDVIDKQGASSKEKS